MSIKLKCLIPNLADFNARYGTDFHAELSAQDSHSYRYAGIIGIGLGIIDIETNAVVQTMRACSENKLIQLIGADELVHYTFTQLVEKQLRSRDLLCIPYRYEGSSLNRPDCTRLPQMGSVTAEITLLEEFDIQRTFTLTIKNNDVPLMELLEDTIKELDPDMSKEELDDWKAANGLSEDNSILFSIMPEDNDQDCEPGLTVDYFDLTGEAVLITYESSDDIWNHIQKIRVLDVQN